MYIHVLGKPYICTEYDFFFHSKSGISVIYVNVTDTVPKMFYFPT